MSRFGFAWVLLLGVLLGSPPARAVTPAVSPEVESALLHQHWEQVHQLLTSDDMAAADPVARLLVAHACLATNRNNDATVLFFSLREPASAEACLAWAEGFAQQHRESAVAHYLRGDACARAGRLPEALDLFDQALRLAPNFVLALNARGVARMMNGDLDGAVADLTCVTEVSRDFADGYASLGTLWVLQNAAEGAAAALDRALEVDPSFALAYNSRGCARFGKGDYEQAKADFGKAAELCPALFATQCNSALTTVATIAELAPTKSDQQPGTVLLTRTELINTDFTQLDADGFGMLAAQDVIGVSQAISRQQADLRWLATQQLEQMKGNVRAMGRWRAVDRFLKTVDLVLPHAALASAYSQGWQSFQAQSYLQVSKGIAAAGLADLPDGGTKTAAEIVRRGLTFTPATPILPLLSLSSYATQRGAVVATRDRERTLVSQGLGVSGLAAKYEILEQYKRLAFAEAIGQGRDLGREDLFGVGRPADQLLGQKRVPEYYTSVGRPLAEAGVLASMTGKTIMPRDQGPRIAVVHGDDVLRSNVLNQGLIGQGFQTVFVPTGVDLQAAARRLNASVIVGVRGPGVGMSLPSLGPRPGGVSTEEIGRTHVDRGDWPVMTTFALAYGGRDAEGEQGGPGGGR